MNFDDKDIHDPRNPVYLPDLPKEPEEPKKCQCCDEDEAIEFWLTSLGRKWICQYCLDYNLENETHFLIQKL